MLTCRYQAKCTVAAMSVVIAMFCLGCAGSSGSGGSATGADARTVAGTSNLVVTVKAVPKRGWRDPGQQSSAYGGHLPGESPAFTRLDYSNLDEIVVWVEPATNIAALPPAVAIDLASPPVSLVVAGSGAMWSIQNTGRQSETVYIRSEEGNVENLGKIDPGGLIDYAPTLAGPLDLMLDSRPDPVARIFVAPSSAVRSTRSNQQVTFNDLPPGPAIVACWHPRLPGSTQPVNLQPGETARVNMTLSVNDLPKVP